MPRHPRFPDPSVREGAREAVPVRREAEATALSGVVPPKHGKSRHRFLFREATSVFLRDKLFQAPQPAPASRMDTQTVSALQLRGPAQQAQPPAWAGADGIPESSEAPPPIAGQVSSRGAGSAQSGHGCGWSNSAMGRLSRNGPQFSHSYSYVGMKDLSRISESRRISSTRRAASPG